MKRPAQNFIVDVFSFVALVLLTTTGVLMAYIIPPGTGHGLTVWGLGRHDWGSIHLWIAFAFLGLLVIHLVLHWKWIVCMVKGRARSSTRPSIVVGGYRTGIPGSRTYTGLADTKRTVTATRSSIRRVRAGAGLSRTGRGAPGRLSWP